MAIKYRPCRHEKPQKDTWYIERNHTQKVGNCRSIVCATWIAYKGCIPIITTAFILDEKKKSGSISTHDFARMSYDENKKTEAQLTAVNDTGVVLENITSYKHKGKKRRKEDNSLQRRIRTQNIARCCRTPSRGPTVRTTTMSQMSQWKKTYIYIFTCVPLWSSEHVCSSKTHRDIGTQAEIDTHLYWALPTADRRAYSRSWWAQGYFH